ncbi:alcohol dehydrogenase catalytic domain-containing protein [Photobacterium sagamiensis]|uniref:alcohol dehydrogenase catalytic domain-containing protein n=1 Tax=Photobacterium sagamiensis TaxID=2910241 RepID=UPI003D0FBAF3
MKKRMLGVVVESNNNLSVIETDLPTVGEDSVLVQVCYSGLCGSDIPRIFHNGAHYYPITLGHEFSGQVIAVGDSVTDVKVGDKVACAPLAPCFKCDACADGHYSLCKHYTFVGSRIPGGNAQYVSVPVRSCFVLPAGVSTKQGAFFEPVTVGIHPILLAGGCEGKNVVIVGVGTIGLLAVQTAKAMGAKSVTAIDIDSNKLEKAKMLGADFSFNSADQDFIQQFSATPDIHNDQLILETAGSPITVKLAIQMAGPKASIGLVGTLHQDLNMTFKEFEQILRKELNLFGSWMNYSKPFPGREWTITAELFKNNQIDVDSLTEGYFGPNDYITAVTALDGKPSNGKILLKWEQ